MTFTFKTTEFAVYTERGSQFYGIRLPIVRERARVMTLFDRLSLVYAAVAILWTATILINAWRML